MLGLERPLQHTQQRPKQTSLNYTYTMSSPSKVWEVFIQKKPGLAFKHVGNCHGYDKKMAIQNARDLYTRRGEGRAIWVVPADAIVSVPLDDSDAFFDPADDKVYRHATFYKIPDGVNHL